MDDYCALYAALAERMISDLRQDPSLGLQKDQASRVIRGLVSKRDGESVWYSFDINWIRVRKDGPEAIALDLIEDLKLVRSKYGLCAD